jgi:hypothetical protein
MVGESAGVIVKVGAGIVAEGRVSEGVGVVVGGGGVYPTQPAGIRLKMRRKNLPALNRQRGKLLQWTGPSRRFGMAIKISTASTFRFRSYRYYEIPL